MKKVSDAHLAVSNTFDHTASLLKEIRRSLDVSFDALFDQDVDTLNRQRKKVKQIQVWSNIIMANVFKVLRLLQKEEPHISFKYAQTIRRLQKLSDGHRDIVLRSYVHTSNQHKGLLDVQVEELDIPKPGKRDVVIKVKDDGAGINVDKVREKAIKQGFITKDSDMSDQDVLQFILQSGVSTAEKVTQVSGRGVGMDVVKTNIEKLNGIIDIDSEIGKGTSIKLKIPLTLAIIQALLVGVQEEHYAIPLASVLETQPSALMTAAVTFKTVT